MASSSSSSSSLTILASSPSLSEEELTLTVKWSEKEYTVQVCDDDSVAELKRRICEFTNILPKQQKFLYPKIGNKLADDSVLLSQLPLKMTMIGYPNEEAGQILMAFVVRKPGSSITEAQVIDFIAKQKEILAHRSIRGFVSHCDWNSILESLWFGVPLVMWLLYAKQHINTFQLVKDLGLAVELRLDSRLSSEDVVLVDEIARAIGWLMDDGDEVRKRVKEVSEKCRLTLMEGGSSFVEYGRLIQDVLKNCR